MLRVAEFQKVSTKQFVNAMAEVKSEIAMFDASDIWDKLKLPRRATKISKKMRSLSVPIQYQYQN